MGLLRLFLKITLLWGNKYKLFHSYVAPTKNTTVALAHPQRRVFFRNDLRGPIVRELFFFVLEILDIDRVEVETKINLFIKWMD